MEFTGNHTGEKMDVNPTEVRAFRETKRDDGTNTVIDWGHGRSLHIREDFEYTLNAFTEAAPHRPWAFFEDARNEGMRLAVNPLAYQSARELPGGKTTAIDLGSSHEVIAKGNFAETIGMLNSASTLKREEVTA